jgi:dTMP kinase
LNFELVFIVLEGLDGSGTTTQTRLLAEALAAGGRRVHATAEPSDGPIGRLLRRFLSGELELDPPAQALLFAADRLHHLQTEVDPQLAAGAIVVSDRYYLSSLAYQSLAGRLDLAWLRAINDHARRPDLTLFLAVPPEVCATRLAARPSGGERYDALLHQREIEAHYRRAIALLRAEGEPILEVDGTADPERVHHQIIGHIDL